MLQSLVVGLGRAGSGLHLAVLARARAAAEGLFGPVVACDPKPGLGREHPGVTVTESIAEAASLVTPESTVVHVCTPPIARLPVLEELVGLGFRRILVEKPLATSLRELELITRLRTEHRVNLVVVAHWLTADLTARLDTLVRERTLGSLRSITVTQHKPRFLRSLTTRGHPTAFDVEIPHSLGVVLRMAGPAELHGAEWTSMRCGGTVLSRLGSARLTLQHANGVQSAFFSDLTSPVRERRITLGFDLGSITGHYPLDENDDHAQLNIAGDRYVFRDDALTAFMLHAYQYYLGHRTIPDFGLHGDVVRVLCAAKDHCRRYEASTPVQVPDHVR